MATTDALIAAGRAVIAACRRDGYLVPSPSATHPDAWTTGVIALAGVVSPEDAAAYLEGLVGIAARREDRTTPGGAGAEAAAPPLPASAAVAVAHRLPDHGRTLLARLWPGLVARHRSLLRDQDPDGNGLIRPALAAGREWMADRVVANSVFARANRDLAEAAVLLGYNPRPFEAWAQQTCDAVNRDLWDEDASCYVDPEAPSADIAGLTTLFAAIPDAGRARRMARHAEPPPHVPVSLVWLQWRGLRRYDLHDAAKRWRAAILGAADAGFPPTLCSASATEPSAATAAVVLDLLDT